MLSKESGGAKLSSKRPRSWRTQGGVSIPQKATFLIWRSFQIDTHRSATRRAAHDVDPFITHLIPI